MTTFANTAVRPQPQPQPQPQPLAHRAPAGAVAACFITIGTAGRTPLFAGVAPDGVVALTDAGRIVRREWLRIGLVRREVLLDAFIVMPDHLHCILRLSEGEAHSAGRALLPALINSFKATCTVQINDLRATPGAPVWRRSFQQRSIRDGAELEELRVFVAENPARWAARG